ncbi:MAG: poly(hydroxyalkanoate) granule-associated protein [Variovorax sp.]|nr:poly(hydroxyalkanoate) granule-associated protein [Variovorax sp.]
MAPQVDPPPDEEPGEPAQNIKDSAHQIWLAGLGAFAKAQQEGAKAFESLVKDGLGMQKKTQAAAEETLAQAQNRMAGIASEFGTRAAGQWGKLENIFEDRVARALEKLGMPSAAEMAALRTRIDELNARIEVLERRTRKPVTTTVQRRAAAPRTVAPARTGAARKRSPKA